MAEEKTKTELSLKDLENLVNVLANTPTQNLQIAGVLIALSNKLSKMIDERK